MRTNFTEATAHAKQLIEVGCGVDEAIADAQRTFELDELTADVMGQCIELWIETEYAHG